MQLPSRRSSPFALQPLQQVLVAAFTSLFVVDGMQYLLAQTVDSEFPAIYNSERDTAASPLPAEQAAAQMKLPAGFQCTVLAKEPDVQNPIGMNWDRHGRLWVAENFTYSERPKRFDRTLRDRVLIFEDTNRDGIPDSHRVFIDSVQVLTSVEIGRGGVWLMCPPQLLFVPDADEDGVPDGPAKVVLDGFEIGPDSYHNFANGLKWGPDGWLYGRCGHSCPGFVGQPGTPASKRIPIDGGLWRYSPETHVFEALCHGTTNPWGHDWDANGELFFVNTVIGHLWHLMPGSHLKESFGESMNPLVFDRLDMIADHYHFNTEKSWADSRDGNANDLGGGHAHIGAAICLDSRWPSAYQGRLFTINMHGRRANVERLERLGAGYVGKHEPDFFISPDPFFRGLELSFGPDGALYVLDWSDTGECHESTGVHRTSGRIYRISPPQIDGQLIASDQGNAKPACMAGEGKLAKIWRAYQSHSLKRSEIIAMLDAPEESVRAWGVRLLSDHWPLDTITGPHPSEIELDPIAAEVAALQSLATREESGLVLSVLASTLQRLPRESRLDLAMEIAVHEAFANDPNLPAMVWYGLMPVVEKDPKSVCKLLAKTEWKLLQKWVARGVASQLDRDPTLLTATWEAVVKSKPDRIASVLDGWLEAFRGRQKVAPPEGWNAFTASAYPEELQRRVVELSLLFGDGRASDMLRAMVLDSKEDIRSRQQALDSLIDSAPPDLRELCEKLLDTRILNRTALRGLAKFDQAEIADQLVRKIKRFQPEDRSAVLETLVSRESFARVLLDALEVKNGPIAPADILPFHARQILNLGDSQLTQRLEKTWGSLKNSSADKLQLIQELKASMSQVTAQDADLPNGRLLFEKNCAQCHKLHGSGAPIGPDLTGSQRSNLDYLLENIVDPSAIVGKDYRMTVLRTEDGRTVSGLVVKKDAGKVTLQTPNAVVAIPLEEIDESKETTLSPMPEGILQTLNQQERRDLLFYLMHPVQVTIRNR